MGAAKPGQPQGKLFFGLLSSSEELLHQVGCRVAMDFSPIETASPIIAFDQTEYYRAEMGDRLLRQWIATQMPIFVTELVSIKHFTNSLEQFHAVDGKRCVNIDPGYLVMSKVVLATTKDYDHRLYIRRGIYEEVTLSYKRRTGFEALPWTYPDYRTDTARDFFCRIRQSFASQLREQDEAR